MRNIKHELHCKCRKKTENPSVAGAPYKMPEAKDYTTCPNCGRLYQFQEVDGQLQLKETTSRQRRLFLFKYGNSHFSAAADQVFNSMFGSQSTFARGIFENIFKVAKASI